MISSVQENVLAYDCITLSHVLTLSLSGSNSGIRLLNVTEQVLTVLASALRDTFLFFRLGGDGVLALNDDDVELDVERVRLEFLRLLRLPMLASTDPDHF